MIKSSAYIHDNRLVIIGISHNRWGVIPFTYDKLLEGKFDNGPVNPDNISDELSKAIDDSIPEIKQKIHEGKVRIVAESLVLRSRQGDQNATAYLIGIRNNAKKNVQQAITMLHAVKRYIEDNPSEGTTFGQDNEVSKELARHVSVDIPNHYCASVLTLCPHVDIARAVVLLANGPLIDKTLLETIVRSFDERESKQFKMAFSGKKVSSEAGFIGEAFRKAQGLQAARKGQFKRFCPVACWELGL